MLFYKSFVSFVTAISLAGIVTASATPMRRTDGCNPGTGSLTCCDSTMAVTGLTKGLFEPLGIQLNNGLPIGVGCVLGSVGGCDQQNLCCGTSIQNKVDKQLAALSMLLETASSCESFLIQSSMEKRVSHKELENQRA
ncbi:hypothetical protein V8E53_000934 [Lactarius tabidus]